MPRVSLERVWGRFLWFALLTACTTAPPPAPRPTPPVLVEPPPVTEVPPEPEPARSFDEPRPAAEHLAGETPTRMARVAFVEAIYAREPGEGVAPLVKRERQDAGQHHIVPVVEERPSSLRVLLEADGVRLVVYLQDADVHPVVRRRARVALGARAEPGDTEVDGVWVLPGAIASGQGVLRSIAIDDPIFKGTAWVARKAVDRVYEAETPNFAASARLAQGTPISTHAGVVLVTPPSGVEVLELAKEGTRARVRYASQALVVEGWVPTSALEHDGVELGDLLGFGRGGGWGTSGETRYLHAGDKLLVAGEMIGVVTGERVRVISGVADALGMDVEVYVGDWPFVPLKVPAEDIAFGDAYEKAFLGRARVEAIPVGAALPWAVTYQQNDMAECWTAALGAGASKPITLRLAWTSGKKIPLPATPKLDPTLHACLEKALDLSFVTTPPKLPVTFNLHLEPTPLPTR